MAPKLEPRIMPDGRRSWVDTGTCALGKRGSRGEMAVSVIWRSSASCPRSFTLFRICIVGYSQRNAAKKKPSVTPWFS
ncbi:hypothetical protein SVAN01_08832 [Stagonosporopsis vannaccii]|nr:hypothetical protein SVAN01_08832 [Stagonosporopsis vannaccii]